MRNILILLLAALAVCPMQGKVRWLETDHDFGAFREADGKVKASFRFVNEGKEPVSIRAVQASCGCTSSSYTHDPVAKGDTAEVVALFNPAGRPGRFVKTLKVDLTGEAKRQTLTVSGVVIGTEATLQSRYPVESGPLRLRTTEVPFGTVLRTRPKTQFVEVYNASTDTLRPHWEQLPSYMRMASSDPAIAPGELAVYSMVITPDASAPYGMLTDSAYIAAPGAEPLKINFSAILEEDFSRLTPGQRRNAPVAQLPSDRVVFDGIVGADGPATRSFTIENQGKSDLLVRRIYTTDPGVTIGKYPEKIKKGKHAEVLVTVDPSVLPSDIISARIQVITNDPEQPLLIVRALGQLAPSSHN